MLSCCCSVVANVVMLFVVLLLMLFVSCCCVVANVVMVPPTLFSSLLGLNQVIYGNPVRALHGLRSQSVLGDCHSLTTTTHPGRRRLHAWELE